MLALPLRLVRSAPYRANGQVSLNPVDHVVVIVHGIGLRDDSVYELPKHRIAMGHGVENCALFELISERYERHRILITTNQPFSD